MAMQRQSRTHLPPDQQGTAHDRFWSATPAHHARPSLPPPGRAGVSGDRRGSVPEPGPDELLIAVHAAAITFDELRWDETWSHLPSTPSHEWSGVVVARGDEAGGTSDLEIGDPAFGLVPFDRNGAAAEYVVVPGSCAARKPVSLSHVEAAALSLAGLTARQALLDQGAVSSEDDVLVMGASGGVGALAVQLAVGLGARVHATTYSKGRRVRWRAGPGPRPCRR